MYKRILVPLDGSELAECVLPHVETIAGGCGVESVTFVRVADQVPIPLNAEAYAFSVKEWEQLETDYRTAAEDYLNRLVTRVRYGSVKIQTKVLAGGRAADMLADYASKNDFELIIIATHGRSGVSRWVWGSVADHILRSACVPVLMIRAPGCVAGI